MSRGIENGDSPYHPEEESGMPIDGLNRLDAEGNFVSPLDTPQRSKYSSGLSRIESSDSMIPPFIKELGELDDSEDYAIDAQSLITFALHLRTLGPNYLQRITEFVQTMQGVHFQLPGEKEDRPKNERMKSFYADFSDVVKMRLSRETVDYDSPYQAILDAPAKYGYYPERDTKRLREEKGKHVQIGTFFAEARGAEDRFRLHSLLEEKLPEAAQMVGKLREKMGKDFLGRDNLDEVVCALGKAVYYGSITSLEKLQQRLGKYLAQRLFGRGEALGTEFDTPGDLTAGYIHNEDLSMVLPALVLYEVKEKIAIEKSVAVDFGSHQDSIEKAEQSYEKLQGDLATQSEKEITRIDRALVETAERKDSFRDFVEENGILPDEVRLLRKLVGKRVSSHHNDSPLDTEFYTVAFHALVLSKQGKIDFRSPLFISFLQSLYPDYAESIEEHLKR